MSKKLPETSTPPKSASNCRPPPSINPRRRQPSSSDQDTTDILEVDHFVKTISSIKSKGIRPDLVGSIIAQYSSKWLPELNSSNLTNNNTSAAAANDYGSTTDSLKKRFFVKTIFEILPKEPANAVPCNFLLGLLRVASMVAADEEALRAELEGRIACQLDQADVKELLLLMIVVQNFSRGGTTTTLLDVPLVIRLVKKFLITSNNNSSVATNATGGGMATIKVAMLVDSYLAEAAFDPNLQLGQFVDLASKTSEMLSGIHSHCGCPYARVNHDGIYRAIDTYLKAHPNLTKQERKQLCRLIDTQKFSPEATLHATHNDRLPVRTVLQLLFSEQTKLTNQLRQHVCHCTRPGAQTAGTSFNAASSSTRQLAGLMASETIQKLNDDLLRVQTHCDTMQRQMENLLTINQSVVSTMTNKKKADSRNNKSGFFGKYVGMIPSFRNYNNGIDGTVEIDYNVYYGGVDDNRIVNDPKGLFGSFMGSSRRRRPCASMDVTKDLIHKARVVSKSWRHSSS